METVDLDDAYGELLLARMPALATSFGFRRDRPSSRSPLPALSDGVFVDAEDRLAFALHPVPTSADVLVGRDRIVRRVARRLADEACDDSVEDGVDVPAQVQAEAAATWRSPQNAKPTVRGVERLRAWCVTSPSRSLHAGVVIADHDREALERLCHYGARRRSRTSSWRGPPVARSRTGPSGHGPMAASSARADTAASGGDHRLAGSTLAWHRAIPGEAETSLVVLAVSSSGARLSPAAATALIRHD